MYYLWREKSMLPSQFYALKAGEKLILTAFVQTEIESNEENQGGD